MSCANDRQIERLAKQLDAALDDADWHSVSSFAGQILDLDEEHVQAKACLEIARRRLERDQADDSESAAAGIETDDTAQPDELDTEALEDSPQGAKRIEEIFVGRS